MIFLANFYKNHKLAFFSSVFIFGLVFLAIPSLGRSRRNQIIKQLNKYKLVVKTLPTISQIVDGNWKELTRK